MSIKAVVRKVLLLVLLLIAAVILQPVPSPKDIIFYAEPVVKAQWEVTTPHNYIGSVITATLRITTEAGVTMELDGVPQVGRVLDLPVKSIQNPNPPTGFPSFGEHSSQLSVIHEGELEVLSRTITRHNEGSLIVIEFAYEFMYVLPIDLSSPRDDKRMPEGLSIYKNFLIAVGEEEKVVSRRVYVPIESTTFFIEPRVDGNSRPIFTRFPLVPPATYWREVTLAGFGCIGLAALLLVLWTGRLISIRRREKLAAHPVPPIAVEALFDEWRETGDYHAFIEALVRFRQGAWGRKPSITMWVKSTFILYGGVMLSHDQTNSVFTQVVREVHNDTP